MEDRAILLKQVRLISIEMGDSGFRMPSTLHGLMRCQARRRDEKFFPISL